MIRFFPKRSGDSDYGCQPAREGKDFPALAKRVFHSSTVRSMAALLLGIGSLIIWIMPAWGLATAIIGLLLSIDALLTNSHLALLALGVNIIGLLCCIINIIYLLGGSGISF